MTAVRKVYQKAIITPTHHIEQLWRDYENFENSVSRQLASQIHLWFRSLFLSLILAIAFICWTCGFIIQRNETKYLRLYCMLYMCVHVSIHECIFFL